MIEDVTADVLIATVILMRDTDDRAVILTEGVADCSIIDPHLDDRVAQTIPALDKKRALLAIAGLVSAGVERVVAVVDADWVGLPGGEQELDGVIYSEGYDIDSDALRVNGVLRRVVFAHCDRESVRAHLRTAGKDSLLDMVEELVGPVGVMRYISHRDGLELRMSDFPISQVATGAGMSLSLEALAGVAVARSPRSTVTSTEILERLKSELRLNVAGCKRFCNGHDMAAAVSLLARKAWQGSLGRDQAERSIRAAIGCAEFRQMRVCRDLRQWAESFNLELFICSTV